MVSSIAYRPQVNVVPTAVQQSTADNCKSELNKIDSDVKNNEITDIAAMAERMRIESQLDDTKVPPVKYVEEIKPQTAQETTVSSEVSAATAPKTVTDVIKRMHSGKQYSSHEHSQMLTSQMNQMAINNRILHGLF